MYDNNNLLINNACNILHPQEIVNNTSSIVAVDTTSEWTADVEPMCQNSQNTLHTHYSL